MILFSAHNAKRELQKAIHERENITQFMLSERKKGAEPAFTTCPWLSRQSTTAGVERDILHTNDNILIHY